MNVKIEGVNPGTPRHQLITQYFEALEARDYRTARVCMMSVLSTSNPGVAAEVLRLTHEMEPPA